MRRVLALLLLASAAHAQAFTNVLWPPRDVDVRERFGTSEVALDGAILAVLDQRDGEPPIVRTYVREGLNWIEDGKLRVLPPRLGREPKLDVDGDRVVVTGSGEIEIFRRFGPRDWRSRVVPMPASIAGDVFLADLSGDWLAAASTDTLCLLQHQGAEWMPTQEIHLGVVYRIALDGDELLIPRPRFARIYHLTGGAWTLEFMTSTDTYECDLADDRLGVSFGGNFRSYDRVGGTWTLSGTFPDDALKVRLTRDHAILGRGTTYTVLEREAGGWVRQGELLPPDPVLYPSVDLAASGSLVVVTSFPTLTENLRGAVLSYALDGSRATLTPSATRMALEDGGTLRLDLDAGPASAGQLFVLAGSLSGSSPGFRVLDRRIPLNRRDDPYYPRSVQTGRLDADGRATVELVLPPTRPGEPLALFLKDRTFHHAFVVWDGRHIAHVSNVALTAIVGRFH